ncbi:single-stranded-DNA-specific exonuclease RecJ [Prochlorococcus sp. MIT 1307]|uniref:single-stranded-DNA-specific exonuclease RecJ n=1 Tax=Prochlorococcus sp. MIT 1307 TaxID=3096219 RepID=UPI002A752F67|nr:single-stranded-DNA-specific exonuclease RecJ [Prochlorococcus sp. MIT 1307]
MACSFSNIGYQAWTLPRPLPEGVFSELDLPEFLKAILVRRGFDDISKVQDILNPHPLPNPMDQYPELYLAKERIESAIKNKEKIAICGDYDADGMTSTALLLKVFLKTHCQAIAAIPSRIDDGYGLNIRMIEELHSKGITLIITVDNGVNAFEAIHLANDLNIDIILTDHHQITNGVPSVLALIHPSTTPLDSPYKNLAGVGLAYILASSIDNSLIESSIQDDLIDLFCIGTIADMAPLTGSNRYILKHGLKNIHRTNCLGLKALYKLCGIKNHVIESETISFQIAPRINAVGRIGDPELILDLFLEDDVLKAMEMAKKCDDINKQRRELSNGVELEATALIEAEEGALSPFILIAQSHWHQGIVGIVASRLVEKYNRPTALLARNKDGNFRASVRAPRGFNVSNALEETSSFLESFGGHPAAGGFTVRPENISRLHEQFNIIADKWYKSTGKFLSCTPDANIKLSDINIELWEHIKKLEPFGVGHTKPLFWSRKCEVINFQELRGGHLKLLISQDKFQLESIYWRAPKNIKLPQYIDIAYHISINEWQGKKSFQLEIRSIREFNEIISIKRKDRIYKCFIRHNKEVVLSNETNEELVFLLNSPYDLITNKDLIGNSYVKSLIEEAKVALGIVS